MVIPVKDKAELKAHGIFFTPATLRKWHHLGRYGEVFVKISSRLFIDTEVWAEIVEDAKERSRARQKKFDGARNNG